MLIQKRIEGRKLKDIPDDILRFAKEYGLSDRRLFFLTGSPETEVREHRKSARHRSGLQTRRYVRRRVRIVSRRICIRRTKRNAKPNRPTGER